jgi:hypothetical protein
LPEKKLLLPYPVLDGEEEASSATVHLDKQPLGSDIATATDAFDKVLARIPPRRVVQGQRKQIYEEERDYEVKRVSVPCRPGTPTYKPQVKTSCRACIHMLPSAIRLRTSPLG